MSYTGTFEAEESGPSVSAQSSEPDESVQPAEIEQPEPESEEASVEAASPAPDPEPEPEEPVPDPVPVPESEWTDKGYPDGDPDESWTHQEIDAWAGQQNPPVEFPRDMNKSDKLAQIADRS